MDDLISRRGAVEAISKDIMGGLNYERILRELPSAQSEIIHCEDCRWWDQKFDDSPMGYCMAAKHNHYSMHWEIHIQRTYGKNFFCADAEPKDEEEEDE